MRQSTLTYYLNRLQGFDAAQPVLVTLNRDEAIDPGRVVARLEYAHPVIDGAAVAVQARQRPSAPGPCRSAARTGAMGSTRTACGVRWRSAAAWGGDL